MLILVTHKAPRAWYSSLLVLFYQYLNVPLCVCVFICDWWKLDGTRLVAYAVFVLIDLNLTCRVKAWHLDNMD